MLVVDNLIECPNFTNVVILIRHFGFVVGDESVRNASASVGFGDTVIGPPSSGPIVIKNEALLSFSSTDHATLLGLGDLDI